MEGIRHSISAHNAAVAVHLQAQQQQAQAQHAAALAQAQQQRNQSIAWHQHQQASANNSGAAQMQNGYSNFMNPMMAMQSNNMNQMAMVATAKLAASKKNKASNSSLAVRSTVPRFNVAGGIYTVAQWARKCVEDNLEFIVKIARRGDPKAELVMLAYGDGCQTLVFLDDAMNKVPEDLAKITKIHVGVSAAPIDDKRTESEIAASGVLQPIDSLWDHLRYEQAISNQEKKENIMHIHTSTTVYGDSVAGRQRVLQIKTKAPKSPFVADSYMRNVMFEQQVLAKWNGKSPGATPIFPQGQMDMAAASAPSSTNEDNANEYLITFNPKELMLLEKAFDNNLTVRDRKAKADKWTDEDKEKCQLTIIRANNEFKYVFPRKPSKKKALEAQKETAAKKADEPTEPPAKKDVSDEEASDGAKENVAKDSAEKPKKPTDKGKKDSSPKKPSKKEEKENAVDSDDEPIVKLKTPAKKTRGTTKKVTPSKKAAPTKKTSTPAPKSKSKSSVRKESSSAAKSPKKATKASASKKRTRDKSVGPPSKKTRSSSASKSRSSRSRK